MIILNPLRKVLEGKVEEVGIRDPVSWLMLTLHSPGIIIWLSLAVSSYWLASLLDCVLCHMTCFSQWHTNRYDFTFKKVSMGFTSYTWMIFYKSSTQVTSASGQKTWRTPHTPGKFYFKETRDTERRSKPTWSLGKRIQLIVIAT